jgi:serine/threonine protein kinase
MSSAPATAEEFLEVVKRSGVLQDQPLDAVLRHLGNPGNGLPEPKEIAARMIADGWVTQFQAQHLLAGKYRGFSLGGYRILELLGSGGMSAVYLCTHPEKDHPVAVKVLPRSLAKDPTFLKRFYREARAVAALNHTNLVRGYGVGQENDQHYFVMEFVYGSSLQQTVGEYGPMPIARAVQYISQAALGLQYAHEQGLVHRDIKPANLLVDRGGVVKILDMGLSLFTNDEDEVLTKDVVGTLDYLAPEQARDSHTVDIRADIYSLGATFYFVLTGAAPVKHRPDLDPKIFGQRQWEPPPVRVVRPQVPEGLAEVLHTMLAFDLERRYQEPKDVAAALEPWARTPIGPPPEQELPKLSPAARRALGEPISSGDGKTGDAADRERVGAGGRRTWASWWPWAARST